jgi:hypothetical protein
LVNQILSTGTVLTKEFSKLVADSPDKLSVDFNNLYKKLEVDAKAEQAKSFLQTQVNIINKMIYKSMTIIKNLSCFNFLFFLKITYIYI